jgi:hypothetical protein
MEMEKLTSFCVLFHHLAIAGAVVLGRRELLKLVFFCGLELIIIEWRRAKKKTLTIKT